MRANTNNPLVSIITPTYNSAAFLAETVRSVQEQTFTDFELLLVDDGSTDETLELAQALTAGDDRIQAWRIAHGGPAVARNAAMERARGRLFALLDSDDVWAPSYLSTQIALLDRHPSVSVVTSNAINRGGALEGRPIWAKTTGVVELRLLDIIAQEDAVCIMSLFRREMADRIGGFDSQFTGNEDYHFWLRAAAAGFRILQNRQPLGYYRRRAGSVSTDDLRMLHGIIAALLDVDAQYQLVAPERLAIGRQVERFREEIVFEDVRASLEKRDPRAALRSLRSLSGTRGRPLMGIATSLAAAWPQSLLWAYDLLRTLRS